MDQHTEERLGAKSTFGRLQVELTREYALSPVEARVLAHRVVELVDEQTGLARQPGQITYQAIAYEEPAGKPLQACRKVAVYLTLVSDEDQALWTREGPEALRRARVERWVREATLQGGVLSQEDLAWLLGTSTRTVKRIFGWYRARGMDLLSRGAARDMGRGVSHKIPVIRKYVQDASLTQISQALGGHGIASMTRYLRHFALVMMLTDRGLSVVQMASMVGISAHLIEAYQRLYRELDMPEHQRTLTRLKGMITGQLVPERPAEAESSEKGGL